ncbi:MAG TPA: hypothetical protein VGI95_20620 [Caulobacteraceae bacterium]
MRSWIVAALLAGLPGAAAFAEPAPITCDGNFIEEVAAPDRAQVIGTARLYFLKDSDVCPGDYPDCQMRSYVVPGDMLLTGSEKDGYTCAFLPNHAKGRSGWVKSDRLKTLPPFPTPHLADWVGVWTDDNDTLRLTLQGAKLAVSGQAFAGTAPPAPGAAPGGRISASEAPRDNFVIFEQKSGRHDCYVSVTKMGEALEVSDNDCGPASFDGEYHRAK